ncbi:MAG TPA: acyl-ACP--UDP-N-acetylglucosamine O-acyltransferase [Acidobacteriota bacterium]|nr:acyl-ACP--UDP-N-acetylglucosamine O-acyltransferase [Acidobacteriota bacterium]
MKTQVHSTAQVSSRAKLAEDVEIGPFSLIGPEVEIGPGTRIGPHSVIQGPTTLGARNHIYGQSSIGTDPQDLKYRGEASILRIGDDNRIREFVTIHRGTEVAGNETVVGSGNLIMTGVHIAHDCRVGDDNILANSATLAGHVEVSDGATVGAFSGVHQFCRVGYRAFIGGYSVITRDALPFIKTVGERGEAKTFGINTIGLERSDYSSQQIGALKEAYRLLFRKGLRLSEALQQLRASSLTDEVEVLLDFIESSQRGFVH